MSRIEQIITEIEEFIDGCKFQPFSGTNIIVNKEEMEELLVELKMRVPDEIKKYQKIINQQDAILADARNQAQSMLSDAQSQIDELVSDHEVMQLAYQKAGEVVEEAKKQAEGIIDDAVRDAAGIRQSAAQYTDSILANVQSITGNAMEEEQKRCSELLQNLQSVYDTCGENREALRQSFGTEAGDQGIQSMNG